MTRLPRLIALFLVAAATSGCQQGVGDRCQLDSDCASNHCAIPAGNSIAQGGTCQAVNDAGQLIAPTDDSGATIDMVSVSGDMAMTPAIDMAMTPAIDMAMTPVIDMAMDMMTPLLDGSSDAK